MTFDPESRCPYNFDPREGDILFSWFDPNFSGPVEKAYSLDAGATWSASIINFDQFISITMAPTTRNDQVQFRYRPIYIGPPVASIYSDIISVAPRDVFFISWNSGGSHEWDAVSPRDNADNLLDVPYKPVGGLSDRIQFGSEILENREVSIDGDDMPLDVAAEIQRRILINDSAASVWLHDGRKITGHISRIKAPLREGLYVADFKMTVVV